jgi:hypothetical protein
MSNHHRMQGFMQAFELVVLPVSERLPELLQSKTEP